MLRDCPGKQMKHQLVNSIKAWKYNVNTTTFCSSERTSNDSSVLFSHLKAVDQREVHSSSMTVSQHKDQTLLACTCSYVPREGHSHLVEGESLFRDSFGSLLLAVHNIIYSLPQGGLVRFFFSDDETTKALVISFQSFYRVVLL